VSLDIVLHVLKRVRSRLTDSCIRIQRKGAAELKERLPVSSLTDGRRRVMTDAERVERLDCDSSLFARYEGLLC